MGIVQKIFYFHVPAAYGMYLGAAICFVASAAYLLRGSIRWDATARAGAEVAMTMGLMVLISGPLWAAKAWGRYWVWDPRLTTSLLSVLIYIAYVVMRRFSGSGEPQRRFAAALGVFGAANLPIIHFSVRKWGGQHPEVITGGGGGLHGDMMLALALGFMTFTFISSLLIRHRTRIHLATARVETLEQMAIELSLGEED